ncbi:MAG TPA: MinD/ParA family protein [Caldilineaceae bacterium]|mgnify:CR=1 FL=1|nr:MinD/ParA family protein [Caldilineaceae bacterium]
MPRIISVHSYRGGTGKSNTTANLAAILAAMGYRVGVIDTDIQSPGIHVLFGLCTEEIDLTLNDYLWRKCPITKATYDVTERLGAPVRGKVFLVPSSIKANAIARILREGYDVGQLSDGFEELIRALNLDVLMIDTHPGLNEETLLAIVISTTVVLILRPDQQDYQGTAVTVDVARKLGVQDLLLLVNKVPQSFEPRDVIALVSRTYQCEVGAILPHSDEMMTLASSGIFALRHPTNELSDSLRRVAKRILEG